jgi:hypothetical protein
VQRSGRHAIEQAGYQRLVPGRILARPRAPVDPDHRAVLQQDTVERQPGDGAAREPEDQVAAGSAQAAQRGLGEPVTDWVDHQVGTCAGDLPHLDSEVLGLVVDRGLRSGPDRRRPLGRAGRRCDHPGAERGSHVDRGEPDPAAGPQDKHPLPRPHGGPPGQREQHRGVTLYRRRGHLARHRVRQRYDRAGRQHPVGGVSAQAEPAPHHPAATGQAGHAVPGAKHLPGRGQARGERQRRLDLVKPADHQPVDEAHARGACPDQDLAGTRLRVGRLLQHQPIRRAELPAHHAAHHASSSIQVADGRAGSRRPSPSVSHLRRAALVASGW